MSRVLKVLLVSLVVSAAFAAAVWAQPSLPPPVPEGVVPQWSPAPGNPRVAYVPNIEGDLFRHEPHYFYYYGGQWYRGKSLYGPWRPVRHLPRAILLLQRSAFKSAPPW